MRVPAVLVRFWPAVAAAVSAAMLATAHVFQSLGYAPCNLCLKQREVYWGALVLAAVGLALVQVRRLSPQAVSLALGAVFLAGAVVAAFHAGVEWTWWPGPSTCVSGGDLGVSASDLTAILDGNARIKPPACDVAAWRMAGLSMAGWNTLASLGLAAVSFAVAFGRQEQGR
jgi:disulfide bond formation protein DsbB